MSEIIYANNTKITAQQFKDLLQATSLGVRRPVESLECLEGMLEHANLIITAWSGDELVGIARSVTDFNFCCYLSDLAVHEGFQRRGIGKALVDATQNALKPSAKLILLAAPDAKHYYEPLGFENDLRCWVR